MVDFPLDGLDMTPWVADFEIRSQLKKDDPGYISKQDCIYRCFAVSNHIGGMGGGHYTAYARSISDGQWYELDDSSTSKIETDNGKNTDKIVTSMSYVLYYTREHPIEKLVPKDAKPIEKPPVAAKPAPGKSAESTLSTPEDAKPEDAKPEDAKPEDAKPADAKPADDGQTDEPSDAYDSQTQPVQI